VPEGIDRCLRSIRNSQFPEDGRHMVLDRLVADPQVVRYLLVAHALDNQLQYFHLTWRERREERRLLLHPAATKTAKLL
jgi:hypothetical protein